MRHGHAGAEASARSRPKHVCVALRFIMTWFVVALVAGVASAQSSGHGDDAMRVASSGAENSDDVDRRLSEIADKFGMDDSAPTQGSPTAAAELRAYLRETRPAMDRLPAFVGGVTNRSAFVIESCAVLMQTSKEKNRNVVKGALEKVDPRFGDKTEYVDTAVKLAQADVNTRELALKYLSMSGQWDADKYGKLAVSTHVAAVLFYGSMPIDAGEEAAFDAVARLNGTPRTAVFPVLGMMGTESSVRMLKRMWDEQRIPEDAKYDVKKAIVWQRAIWDTKTMMGRDEVLEELEDGRKLGSASRLVLDKRFAVVAAGVMKPGDLAQVLETRRRVVSDASTLAVQGYINLTELVWLVINRYALYRDVRGGKE
jgi:hypothetical protein